MQGTETAWRILLIESAGQGSVFANTAREYRYEYYRLHRKSAEGQEQEIRMHTDTFSVALVTQLLTKNYHTSRPSLSWKLWSQLVIVKTVSRTRNLQYQTDDKPFSFTNILVRSQMKQHVRQSMSNEVRVYTSQSITNCVKWSRLEQRSINYPPITRGLD